MAKDLATLDLRDGDTWRAWLSAHHATSPGVWLLFHKRHTGVACISYEAAVRQALCFGWIDSLVRRLDEDRYVRKFTPRKPRSVWSPSNRRRWVELEESDLRPAPPPKSRDRRRWHCRRCHPGASGLHRRRIPGRAAGLAPLPDPCPDAPAPIRGVDSHGQAAVDTREAHPRVHCPAGRRQKARPQIAAPDGAAGRTCYGAGR